MAEYYQYKIRQTGAFRESLSSIFWQNKTVKNSVPEFIKKNIKYWSINVLLVPKRLEVLEHKFSRKENHFKHCLLNWDRSNMHKIVGFLFEWLLFFTENKVKPVHTSTQAHNLYFVWLLMSVWVLLLRYTFNFTSIR